MLNITGIGNLNELQVSRPLKGPRNLSADRTPAEKQDGVQFSPESQGATEVARFIRDSEKASEIRQERVDAAKENVEQGRHKVEEVVHAVAAALAGYV